MRIKIGSVNGLVPSGNKHYLSNCWPRLMLPYIVTRPQWVKLCFLPITLYKKVRKQDAENKITLWHWNTFCIIDSLWGESYSWWWIHLTKDTVMQSFDVSTVISLERLLNKQSGCQQSTMLWYSLTETPQKLLGFYRTNDRFLPDFAGIKHGYTKEFFFVLLIFYQPMS